MRNKNREEFSLVSFVSLSLTIVFVIISFIYSDYSKVGFAIIIYLLLIITMTYCNKVYK